jgi:hypothetical protein
MTHLPLRHPSKTRFAIRFADFGCPDTFKVGCGVSSVDITSVIRYSFTRLDMI